MPRIVFGNYKDSIPNFTPYHQNIITQRPKKYNLNIDNYIGDVDFFGILHDPTELGTLDMSDVWIFPNQYASGFATPVGYMQKMFYNNTGLTGVVKLGGKNFSQNSLKECFDYSGVTGFEFTELESISTSGSRNPFEQSDLSTMPNLQTVKFDKLQSIGISITFQSAFKLLPRLTTFEAPLLVTISSEAVFQEAFYGTSSLTTIDFSNLEYAATNSFTTAFAYTGLTSVSFPHLYTAQVSSFRNAFYGCSFLTTADFGMVSGFGTWAFRGTFTNCTALEDVYFHGLTINCFTGYNEQFKEMLTGCNNVTVHFPAAVQSVAESNVDVMDGFNGTNTSVVYDL